MNLMDAILEEKETRKKVVVASTHLWWMFESEKDNLQRLQNVAQFVLPDKSVIARNHSERIIDYVFTYNTKNFIVKKFEVLTSEQARKSSDHSPLLAIIEM